MKSIFPGLDDFPAHCVTGIGDRVVVSLPPEQITSVLGAVTAVREQHPEVAPLDFRLTDIPAGCAGQCSCAGHCRVCHCAEGGRDV